MNIIDHCIEWARDQFALLFTKLIKNVESYLKDPLHFETEMKSMTGLFTVTVTWCFCNY